MKTLLKLMIVTSLGLFAACRPAAPPVAISNKPVSINDVPLTSDNLPPSKPLEEMTLAVMDPKTTIEGEVKKLKDYKGKVLIMDFWATYCGPCIQEIPHLKSLQAKYGKDKLEIVGMHVGGDEDRRAVPAFAERLKIDYTLAIPEEQLTRFIFGSKTDIPQTAVFDREGKLVTKIIGFDSNVQRELDAAVEKAAR